MSPPCAAPRPDRPSPRPPVLAGLRPYCLHHDDSGSTPAHRRRTSYQRLLHRCLEWRGLGIREHGRCHGVLLHRYYLLNRRSMTSHSLIKPGLQRVVFISRFSINHIAGRTNIMADWSTVSPATPETPWC